MSKVYRHELVQQTLCLLRDTRVSYAPVIVVHHSPNPSSLLQRIDQTGNVSPADQQQISDVMQLHSFFWSVTEQQKYVQGRLGKSIVSHITCRRLMEHVVRVQQVQRGPGRMQIEACVTRPAFTYTLVIEGFPAIIGHNRLDSRQIVKFLIILPLLNASRRLTGTL